MPRGAAVEQRPRAEPVVPVASLADVDSAELPLLVRLPRTGEELTPHLSEPDRGPIASSGGSGVNVFAAARPATGARNAGLPAFDKGSSICHNRGSNTVWSG